MKSLQNQYRIAMLTGLSLLVLLSIIGCSSFRNGAPPTKVEQGLFDVRTNYVPVAVSVTNAPATPGGEPSVVTQTNFLPNYVYTPGPAVKDLQTGLGLIPGYGGLAGSALGVLAAVWGWLRSAKNKNTSVTLAQSVETIREFIKQLPNGTTYDTALTAWMQNHQAETGTIGSVLDLLENDVSNPEAQIAAQQLRATIQALNASALPPKTG